MGIGPIPRSKIKDYLRDEMELEGEELDRALAILRKTDDVYSGMINSSSTDKDDDKTRDIVKPTDTVGVKQLLRRLAKPNKDKAEQKKK